MCFSPQRRAIFRHLNRQKCSKPVMFCTFWLANVRFATASGNFSTAERQKVLRRLQFFNILTFKCAFRHSGVQFFDIWTDKSAPNPSCFVHFDLQMCFSPQRRAIFRHLNRQKWSKHAVFCTFWLANVLFATAACNFWFLLWPHDSAPAALTGLLLDWPDTRIIEKTQHFATSLTFGADVSSFFWLSDYCIFCPLTWHSTAELCICFSTLHIVGSFYLNFLRLTNQFFFHCSLALSVGLLPRRWFSLVQRIPARSCHLFLFSRKEGTFSSLKLFSMWVWFSFLVGVRHYNELFRIQEGFPEGWDWFTWAFLVGNFWMLETIWRPQVPASSRWVWRCYGVMGSFNAMISYRRCGRPCRKHKKSHRSSRRPATNMQKMAKTNWKTTV